MAQILQGAGESPPRQRIFFAEIAGKIAAGRDGKRRNDGKEPGYARYSGGFPRNSR
jgi:hypothetical protein